MSRMEVFFPKTLEEAGDAVAKGMRPIAGGTDLVPLMKLGLKGSSPLFSLSKIPSLRGITVGEDSLVIGSCVSLTEVAQHEAVRAHFPALVQASLAVGTPQLRNQGTLGGNILQDRRCLYFNQSAAWRSSFEPCYKTGGHVCYQIANSSECAAFYYSDTATALLALGATATIMRGGEILSIPLEELIQRHVFANGGVCAPDFILAELRIPFYHLSKGSSFFMKVAPRASFDFPLLNLAIGRAFDSVRLYAGAWGRLPLRLLSVEKTLCDTPEISVKDLSDILRDFLEKNRSPIREAGIPPKARMRILSRVNPFAEAIKKVVKEGDA